MKRRMNTKMNTKGSYWMMSKPIYILLILLVVPMSIFAYAGAGSSLSNIATHYPDTLREDLVVARLLNDCIVREGVIVYERLEERVIQECFLGEELPAFTITVSSFTDAFVTREVNFNYFAKNQIGTTRYVLVNVDGNVYPGTIEVVV